ncbi:MAG: hypothetical protein ACOYN6_01920 [Ignavibacteria bacterium]
MHTIIDVINCVVNHTGYTITKDNILELYVDESCESEIPDVYFKYKSTWFEEDWDEDYYKYYKQIPIQTYYLVRPRYDSNRKIDFFLEQIPDGEFIKKQLTEIHTNLITESYKYI